jgi:hypothetical protein
VIAGTNEYEKRGDVRATKWSALETGTALEIVKLAPDGSVAAHYPGVVFDLAPSPGWISVRAHWTMHEVVSDGLRFVRGDELHEFFSPDHGFNVFSVFSPKGELRGWYANVTRPAWVDLTTSPATLYWHDLYVDLILLPGSAPIVRDEDELSASGLAAIDPELHAAILKTRDELVRLAERRDFPFHEG